MNDASPLFVSYELIYYCNPFNFHIFTKITLINHILIITDHVEMATNKIEERMPERTQDQVEPVQVEPKAQEVVEEKLEDNQPAKRRRSSECSGSNPTTPQRARRKSTDDTSIFSKSPSPKVSTSTNPFNEVESELEKMFAGIVETERERKPPEINDSLGLEDKSDLQIKMEIEESMGIDASEAQNEPSTSVDVKKETKVTPKKGKKTKGRAGKRKFAKTVDSVFGPDMADVVPSAKKKRMSKAVKKQEVTKKTKKNAKIDGVREMTYDSGSNASSVRSRGPVVHVEGPRDSPLSVQVVNAPQVEEEEKNKEKRKSVGNCNSARSKRMSHQNDLDYRGEYPLFGVIQELGFILLIHRR